MARTKAPQQLLVELGTEELPPKSLTRLATALATELTEALDAVGLLGDTGASTRWYASPRRLAVQVPDVIRRQPDQLRERRGPATTAAFDADGQPTAAAQGFARSCGVSVEDLEELQGPKGSWLVHRVTEPGRDVTELVPDCIAAAIQRLPIRKRMRWGNGAHEFVRPVHWLVVLFGSEVVDCQVLGVEAGRVSQGHRFCSEKGVRIDRAENYESAMEKTGAVIADFDRRRKRVRQQVVRLSRSAGGVALIDDDLLNEVTGLVEWPQALLGDFDPAFLEMPGEVLISSMQGHQKYFPVIDETGALLPHFVTVSNLRRRQLGRVKKGNERVLRARLADAKFFWEEDLKRPLHERAEQLQSVLFHHALGSVFDKVQRLVHVARTLANHLELDAPMAARAALLSKSDLVTDMVGEFPELQGTIGRYYAEADGEPTEVSRAIEEHYFPRHAGGDLPTSSAGRVVALADKADTILGIFSTGEEPTGDKDPFGLRRSAVGLIRIMIESGVELDLNDLIDAGAAAYAASGRPIARDVRERAVQFITERYRSLYDTEGFGADEIAAVMAEHDSHPLDFDQRLRALASFRKHRDAESLAASNKRIRNILRRSEETIPNRFAADLFQDPAEQALADAVMQMSSRIAPLVARRDYAKALHQLVELKKPIDQFFDQVMVMAEETDLRRNRLALLRQLSDLFGAIADISLLQTGSA